MIITFCVNICLYSLGEIFDADLIRFRCFLTPVPGGRLAHEIHIHQNIHNGILDEVKLMAVFFPWLSIFVLKCLFEFLHASGLCELLLQIGQMRKGSTETLHLMEDAKEYIDDGILVLFASSITLGIDIKEHHIRRSFRCQLHVCQHHRIDNLFIIDKEIQCTAITDLFVLQKIG